MARTVEMRIYGRVFSVGFRRYVHRYALENRIVGFVENEVSTGSVHIVAEGEDDNLDAFVALCSHGTPYSIVTRVEVSETNPRHFESFGQIR